MPIEGYVAIHDGHAASGHERLLGYLRVASAEADMLGDHHLRDRIEQLIMRVAGPPTRRPAAYGRLRGGRL